MHMPITAQLVSVDYQYEDLNTGPPCAVSTVAASSEGCEDQISGNGALPPFATPPVGHLFDNRGILHSGCTFLRGCTQGTFRESASFSVYKTNNVE